MLVRRMKYLSDRFPSDNKPLSDGKRFSRILIFHFGIYQLCERLRIIVFMVVQNANDIWILSGLPLHDEVCWGGGGKFFC